MKKIIIILISISLFYSIKPGFSQSYYNYTIDTLLTHISHTTINKVVKELSGYDPCVVGGDTVTILTRAYNFPGNDVAAQYIYEKFDSYGLNPSYWQFSSTGKNVIGKITGTKYPNQKYIICGHFDSYPWVARSPGCDDNATGTCVVLEAARLLSGMSFDYTMVFIAMDEEERGLYGSAAYADSCYAHGDSIICVLNYDMIAYDANMDKKVKMETNTSSLYFANTACSVYLTYVPYLIPNVSITTGGGSDNYSFWQRGYKAIWPFEDDYDPYVNSLRDSMSYFNQEYFLSMARAAVALFATLGKDYLIDFYHTPLTASIDTLPRPATIVIKSKKPLAGGSNAPRLYYKVNSGIYIPINAYYNNLDTLKFLIPGASSGSTVYYYFAVQDSSAALMATYPAGGRGFSPPGSQPPPNPFSYYITVFMNQCSASDSLIIPPGSQRSDSIIVTGDYYLGDLDVNLTLLHPEDQSINITLYNPQGMYANLTNLHGGTGANYINTTFDDEAQDSIRNGIPPFTGSFIPDQPLNIFDNRPIKGKWRLRIINLSTNYSGVLVNWCLRFHYYNPIGISNNRVPLTNMLYQNYPNPFNPRTKIKYQLAKQENVKLIIYDILGREVTTLINDKLNQGSYEAEWDASKYASGVYFYKLITGDFIETKKMVIVK